MGSEREAAGEVRYVQSGRQLDEVLSAVRSRELVAVDTEFVGEGSYQPILCLAQVATEDGIWIVDPLAVNDLSALWQLLTEPGREVIALAPREELRFCLRYAGRVPDPLFDPQTAAALVGYGYPLSHTNLVRQVLGVRVAGGESFTDWRRRPLTERQMEYAADDVRYLLAVRNELLKRAEALGRTEWIRDECRNLVERIVAAEREERWWKVSGGGNLRPRELAVLRELWRWRDQEARAGDLPPRRVLKDEMLVEIAKRKPATTADLFALRGLERGAVRSAGSAIVGAVQTALKLPDQELPKLLRRDDPPQVQVLQQLLSVATGALSQQHQVDPALLATTSDLQELVRWRLGLTEEKPPLLEGWRGEILGGPLLDLLDGKGHVRVGNLKEANPLVFE
ncbi:MAG: ribonuclease D [Armatimonadota bacterium]